MNDEYLPGAGAADPSDEAHHGEVVARPMPAEHEAAKAPLVRDAIGYRPAGGALPVDAIPAGTAASANALGPASSPATSRSVVEPDTAGGMIRTAREAQGIDLASLAAMLKIPLRKLEALEEGRHADLPGHTFERALAQAACRVLKLDPKPVLALLPQVGANTLEHMGGGINTPFRERTARGDSGETPLLLRPAVLVSVLIVMAALALFFIPADVVPRLPKLGLGSDAASAPATSASDTTGANGTTSTTAVTLPVAAAPSSTAATGSPPIAAATAGVTSAVPAATAPASAAAPAGVDEVLAHSETPPSIPVQVMAAEDSWIEVVDAQGHVLLSRTVIAGESVGLDGSLPMKVKIGNARGTRLSLRGENVDLEPWTRDNVARLDLK